tara:strand:+ start:120 stop:452 length:333 start_codon:yes stop_codon:yes gene_type:complete
MGIIRVVKKVLIALTTILDSLSISLYLYAQLTGPLGPIPRGSLTGKHIKGKPIWRELLTRGGFIEVEWSGDPPYSITLDPHLVGKKSTHGEVCRTVGQSELREIQKLSSG